ncbi:hypothetical protein JRC04_05180 [Mycolicibacterium sp. S2-37]|uniref:hypothetical protein n=1 Tax=Mycolicibacterium sp. S2-37 TaxID=2810297 RepID=UPI001A94753B|nr:hypothetical protein [Mycolicibacterium sp. S2-37]MBO0676850.1 hypothetical protein [Mycolicibacterium sp. S2-37]
MSEQITLSPSEREALIGYLKESTSTPQDARLDELFRRLNKLRRPLPLGTVRAKDGQVATLLDRSNCGWAVVDTAMHADDEWDWHSDPEVADWPIVFEPA